MPERSRILALLLVLAAALRLFGLPGQGLLMYDEALQALQAKYLVAHAKAWIAREPAPAPAPDAPAEHPPAIGKHGHVALVALVMAVAGPVDWAGPLVSAAFGLLTILLVYRFGRAAGGEPLGIAAAGLLAFSGIHLVYSREGLAESDTAFFILLGAYLTWGSGVGRGAARGADGARPTRRADGARPARRLALAGLSLGAAFLCNFRSAAHAGVLIAVATAAILLDRDAAAKSRAGRISALLGAFALLPVSCEGLYVVLRALGHARAVPSYFEDLAFYARHLAGTYSVFETRGAGVGFLVGYLDALRVVDGPARMVLLVAGIAVLVRAPRSARLLYQIPAIAPVLFYGLYRGGGLRFISASIPFLAIVEADGLLALLRWAGRWRRLAILRSAAARPASTALATAAVAAISLPQIAAPLRVASADRRAIAEACALPGGGKIVSTRFYADEFYAPPGRVLFPPDSEWELYQMFRKGARALVTDHERFVGGFHGPVGDAGLADLVHQIRTTRAPARTIENPAALAPQVLLERTVEPSAVRALRSEIARDPDLRTVKIYDLATVFEGVPESALRARAIPEFRRRLALGDRVSEGNRATYLEKLGYLLASEGQWDAAAAAYEEMLRIDPASTTARFDLGLLSEMRGDAERALAEYEEVVRLAPQDGATWARIARIAARLGRKEAADRALGEAARLNATPRAPENAEPP